MTEYEYMQRRADRCARIAQKTSDRALRALFYRAGETLKRKAADMALESAIIVNGRKL